MSSLNPNQVLDVVSDNKQPTFDAHNNNGLKATIFGKKHDLRQSADSLLSANDDDQHYNGPPSIPGDTLHFANKFDYARENNNPIY